MPSLRHTARGLHFIQDASNATQRGAVNAKRRQPTKARLYGRRCKMGCIVIQAVRIAKEAQAGRTYNRAITSTSVASKMTSFAKLTSV